MPMSFSQGMTPISQVSIQMWHSFWEWVHRDKQSVLLVLQPDAIKPLQKKRAKQDGMIKKAPVRPHMGGKNVETMMKKIIFMSPHCCTQI